MMVIRSTEFGYYIRERKEGKAILSDYNLYICNEGSPGKLFNAISVERLLPIYFLDKV